MSLQEDSKRHTLACAERCIDNMRDSFIEIANLEALPQIERYAACRQIEGELEEIIEFLEGYKQRVKI